jgi:hypothetical protein
MTRRTSSPVRPSARLGGAVLIAAAALSLGPALAAAPPAHRAPLYVRVQTSLFPSDDPGYLPLVGTPPLRFRAATPPPAAITPPPIILYAPPPPRQETPPSDATTVAPTAPPATAQIATAPERPPPPMRPEDFLPYFQLNDGSANGSSEGLQFTPARPALPTSQAEYRQQ